MESMQKTALLTAIAIEIRSLSFYRAMLSKVDDINTRRIVELLAREESDHLESFCNLYPGNDDELSKILVENNVTCDPYYKSLLESIEGDSTEKDALRIALKEEQSCIEWYSVFVDTIREPGIRDVFARILNETNQHYELISEEYMRLMKMVDTTDQDIYVRE